MRVPRLSWFARLLVSVLVLAALFWIVPVGTLWTAMRAVPVSVWAATLLLFLVGHAIAAFKWHMLMPKHENLPPRLWLTAHFAGLVANLCLPGLASGDVVRAGWIIRHAGHGETVAIAGVVDRAIDCAALLTLATAGLVAMGEAGGSALRVIAITAAILLIGAAAGGTTFMLLRRRERDGVIGRSVHAIAMLADRPWRPVMAFALSIGVQSTFLVLNAQLGRSAGVDVSIGAWLAAWPLAKIAALIPLGLAGLGLREAAIVAFMRPFGAQPGPVMAAGLLWEGVLFSSGLIGWTVTHLWPAANTGQPGASTGR